MSYIGSQTSGPQEPAVPLRRLNLCWAGEGSLGFTVAARLFHKAPSAFLFWFVFSSLPLMGHFWGI